MAQANPYLLWLDDAGPFPLPTRPRAFRSAVAATQWLVKTRRAELLDAPSWTRFCAAVRAHERLAVLLVAMDRLHPFETGTVSDALQDFAMRVNNADDAAHRRVAADDNLRTHMQRWSVSPYRTAAQKRWLLSTLHDWRDTARLPAIPPSVRLQTRFQHHAIKIARSTSARAHLSPQAMWDITDSGLVRSARAAARRKGLAGGLVNITDPRLNGWMSALTSRDDRRALWQAAAAVAPTAQWIAQALAASHTEACALGHKGHVARSFAAAACPHSQKVYALLLAAGRRLAPAVRRQRRNMNEVGRSKYGLVPPQPWDEEFLASKISPIERRRALVDPDVFPLRATLERAVPELLSCGGWTCTQSRRHMGARNRFMEWDLVNAAGRRATFILAPFAPYQSATAEAAYTAGLRDVWRPGGRGPATVMVSLQLAPSRNNLELHELQNLAHEMGHVLHALRMPGETPHEWRLTDNSICDVVETPSQLLEAYARTPDALMRWASQSCNAKYHTSAYWEGMLSDTEPSVLDVQTSLWQALVDLRVNMVGPGADAHAIGQSLRKPMGLAPLAPDDPAALSAVSLQEGYAGNAYTYDMGLMLVEHLLPWKGGRRPDSTAVRSAYEGILDNVLGAGADPVQWSRAWEQWRGKTIIACATEGMRARSRRLSVRRHRATKSQLQARSTSAPRSRRTRPA